MRRSAILRSALTILTFLLVVDAARADQAIYDDTLQNGWMNWSWCTTDLASTEFVHSGSGSIKATYTAGYQGLYLSHANFDSSPYISLRFWINGGAVSGRSIT